MIFNLNTICFPKKSGFNNGIACSNVLTANLGARNFGSKHLIYLLNFLLSASLNISTGFVLLSSRLTSNTVKLIMPKIAMGLSTNAWKFSYSIAVCVSSVILVKLASSEIFGFFVIVDSTVYVAQLFVI